MAEDNILTGLNDKQLEAVKTTEGYVRVVAGAGSGKTRALAHRYAYIVEYLGIDPDHILCVTFTNKAAGEMKRRVTALLGSGYDNGLIVTYHGFCVRVLREDIHRFQFPRQFIILDEEDQKAILREIYEELGMRLENRTFRSLLLKIAKFKEELDYVYMLADVENKIVFEETDTVEQQVIKKYLLKQKKIFGLDFDDLINFTLVLFQDYEEVLEKWQKKLHYIQVDEFQDSSAKQIAIVDLVSKRNKNLFVVGDPDQTIYEWRGARPEYFVDFNLHYPTCKTIILNENYRSTPEILNLGNALIKQNKLRVDKDMFTRNPSGVKVVHFHGKNESEEVKWIIERIRYLEKEGVNLNEIAILYRANFLSRYIEQGLINEGIDYTIYGGFKFFQRREVKDALAYLRLIAVGDDLSFLRVINNPRRGMGPRKLEVVRKVASESGLSYLEVVEQYQGQEFLSDRARKFIELILDYQDHYINYTVSDLLTEVLEKSGYMAALRQDGDQERLDNLTELMNSVVAYERANEEEASLHDYLQSIALYTDYEKEPNHQSVKMMTIHTAKGLEFSYVFLISFNDGILPNARSLEQGKKRALEEERRLMYVAITRAMKEFYMTESEGIGQNGKNKIPSRFIFEIKESLFDRIGVIEEEFIQESKEYITLTNSTVLGEAPADGFQVDEAVEHPVFGKGIVKEVDPYNRTYAIQFEGVEMLKPISFDFKRLVKYSG
ncbi:MULTISPECIES: ATP-dependent helicase [unclassified Jeotgalibaca]|uniref:ATP-dependent helicase n=1 Tax=unclassified Jeotgalibaca TaxID=2621505 RepID=UPI003FD27FD6